jgi:hypothetical protein
MKDSLTCSKDITHNRGLSIWQVIWATEWHTKIQRGELSSGRLAQEEVMAFIPPL